MQNQRMQHSNPLPRYLIANWKSHKNWQETQLWLDEFETLLLMRRTSWAALAAQPVLEIMLAVSDPVVLLVGQRIRKWQQWLPKSVAIRLAIQNISRFEAGSYTGETAIRTIEGMDVEAVILGHSERRQYCAESDLHVAQKVRLVLDAGLTPIICVDDPYIESLAYEIKQVISNGQNERVRWLVAYEAAATIGTGQSLDSDGFASARERMVAAFNFSAQPAFLYGGSVSSQNVNQFNQADGVLVGSASLQADDFMAIVDRMLAE